MQTALTQADMNEHKSDCARHNEPAYEVGPCTCGSVLEPCSIALMPAHCPRIGIWAVLTDSGKAFVSCDKHLSWVLYGDGSLNRVFTIEERQHLKWRQRVNAAT